MSFSTNDFLECLNHGDIKLTVKPDKVLLAWGVGGRDYNDWEGGFVLHFSNNVFAYLSGWSDSSGWG